MLRSALLFFSSAVILLGQQPTLVIPHFADGGAWKSTIAIFNRINAEPVRVTVNFRDGEGRRVAVPIQNVGTVSFLNMELAVQSATYLETLGTSASVQVGWVEVVQAGGVAPVTGFAVFRQTIPGRPDFEAVSNGMRGAGVMTFPFDNTNGFVTGFAMVNLTPIDCTIAVSAIFDESGAPLSVGSKPIGYLAANGHAAFVATDRMPELANRRGHLTFSPLQRCGAEGFAMLGLRFNPFGSFTNVLPLNVAAQ